MKKCPNCAEKSIKTFNKYNMLPEKQTTCPNCHEEISSSKSFIWKITIPYVVFIIAMFLLHLPLDDNFIQFMSILLGSGIIMYVIQNVFIPFEVKNKK